MDPFTELSQEHQLEEVQLTLPDGCAERYLYSPDKVYRYAFGRWWGDVNLDQTAVWVMLNPATGDTDGKKRATLTRAIGRSKEWSAQGILVVNLFAYRSTDPSLLRAVSDPIGPANDDVLRILTSRALVTVAAWGGKGGILGRSAQVRPMLTSALCLGTTRRDEPRHPLYVSGSTPAVALPQPSIDHGSGVSGPGRSPRSG